MDRFFVFFGRYLLSCLAAIMVLLSPFCFARGIDVQIPKSITYPHSSRESEKNTALKEGTLKISGESYSFTVEKMSA